MHLAVIGLLIHHSAPWVAPIRLPGSEHGTNLMLTYLPGRAPIQAATPAPKTTPTVSNSVAISVPKQKDTTTSPNTNTPGTTNPDSTIGADALGSGNIDIARVSYFPSPAPDLSTLPSGTTGDVILDIVIDTNGHISALTMTRGLGYGIDETVIATVEQWKFFPATRNGQPVASEQELHFHYEKA